MAKTFHDLVLKISNEIVENRRWLHRHAELSFKEVETSAYLEEKLKQVGGLDVSRPTPTSVMAVLKTGRPGPVVAVRADIDALPMCEVTGLDYVSLDDGAMHACGHDGHAAIVLAAAQLLAQHRDALRGEIRFIFQHAEEVPPGGAVEVIAAGVLNGVDEVYGLHLTSTLPTGRFGIRSGVLTSSTDRFEITVQGKGGHSSMPYECIDPIAAGAEIITALQSIPARRVNPREVAVVLVCKVQAGTAYNVIPDEMQLTGSVRTFSPAVQQQVKQLIGEISEGVAKGHGARALYEYIPGYPSVVNDEKLTDFAIETVRETFGDDAVVIIEPMIPGDDFSYYHQNCPGFFVEVGAANEQKGINAPHHNPAYQLDEDALLLGAEYVAAMLAKRLKV